MWPFEKKVKTLPPVQMSPALLDSGYFLHAMIDSSPSLAAKVLLKVFDLFPHSRHLNLAISVVSAEMGVRLCKDSLERFVMQRPGLAQDAAKHLIKFRRSDVEPIIVSLAMPFGQQRLTGSNA